MHDAVNGVGMCGHARMMISTINGGQRITDRLLRYLLKAVVDVFQPAISYSPLLDNASDVARQTEANTWLSHRWVHLQWMLTCVSTCVLTCVDGNV